MYIVEGDYFSLISCSAEYITNFWYFLYHYFYDIFLFHFGSTLIKEFNPQ